MNSYRIAFILTSYTRTIFINKCSINQPFYEIRMKGPILSNKISKHPPPMGYKIKANSQHN